MKDKILFVDDDDNLLSAVRRMFRNRFDLTFAHSPDVALGMLQTEGPFSVVVSDMRMPGMNGIEFLGKVKEKAPNTVRIMMTGNSDQQTARTAINEGQVFRFLQKPCSTEEIEKVVIEAIGHARILNFERTLLEETLQGSVSLLSDILSLTAPELFHQASGIQQIVEDLAKKLAPAEVLQIKLASLFSDIAAVVVPSELLIKAREAVSLSVDESHALFYSLDLSRSLLSRIPRLQRVAELIFYQYKNFDGTGEPRNAEIADVPMGSRIIRVCKDYIHLKKQGLSIVDCFKTLTSRSGVYDPVVIKSLAELILQKGKEPAERRVSRSSLASDLEAGQRLEEALFTVHGLLLFAAGTELSELSIRRILNHAKITGVREPVLVSEIISEE
jgi:response regulator RpfG family c-di-GMP phosphodiesterase